MQQVVQAKLEIKFNGNAQDYIKIIGKQAEHERSKVAITMKNNTIKVQVSASDCVALFSALNSILKQFSVISKVDQVISRIMK